jgi:hypothetical protein
METACLEVKTMDFELENVLTQVRLVATACTPVRAFPSPTQKIIKITAKK